MLVWENHIAIPAKYDNHLIPVRPAWWFECQTNSGKNNHTIPISAMVQTMPQAKPTWNRKDDETCGLQTHIMIIQDIVAPPPCLKRKEKQEEMPKISIKFKSSSMQSLISTIPKNQYPLPIIIFQNLLLPIFVFSWNIINVSFCGSPKKPPPKTS